MGLRFLTLALLLALAHAATQYRVLSKQAGTSYLRLNLQYTGQ